MGQRLNKCRSRRNLLTIYSLECPARNFCRVSSDVGSALSPFPRDFIWNTVRRSDTTFACISCAGRSVIWIDFRSSNWCWPMAWRWGGPSAWIPGRHNPPKWAGAFCSERRTSHEQPDWAQSCMADRTSLAAGLTVRLQISNHSASHIAALSLQPGAEIENSPQGEPSFSEFAILKIATLLGEAAFERTDTLGR
jgi:hypothetical protein